MTMNMVIELHHPPAKPYGPCSKDPPGTLSLFLSFSLSHITGKVRVPKAPQGYTHIICVLIPLYVQTELKGADGLRVTTL